MFSIEKVLASEYNITPDSIKKLDGYDSENYLITSNNERYIYKQYSQKPLLDVHLDAECRILDQISRDTRFEHSIPLKNIDGDFISYTNDERYLFRLLNFVHGDFLASTHHTPALASSFGRILGSLDNELRKQEDPIIQGRKSHWDLQYLLLNEPYINQIHDPGKRKLVEYYMMQYKLQVLPYQDQLRKSIIHNDANDWNVLVTNGQVSGIIDFGDMVYAPLINEMAVALTYLIMGKEDPIAYAILMVEAYHQVLPLQEQELQMLYYLIAGRLCMSVINSAHTRKQNPDNDYISISEEGAWALLDKWITINPIKATSAFKDACSFDHHPNNDSKKIKKKRKQFFSNSLSISYDTPIEMKASAFQYMYDAHGETYLDTYNNIPHVGHCHPHVVKAGQEQMALLNTNTRYLYEPLTDYAEKLLNKFPASLNKVFFVNSGSAASDLAIRLALTHTKHQKIIVMEHGYHGNTSTAIDLSHYKYAGKGGMGTAQYILEAELPDTYKGRYTFSDAGERYAKDLKTTVLHNSGSIAAFIAEPIVGCGGQVPLAKGYLQHIYPAIREHGGVCISDEVQTGFGRLGSHFWGFELHGVVPDIVILGKPIANGHPMGAIVTTSDIAASFETGMEFFSSFGGNPVSCRIAEAVLDVIESEQLQKNAHEVGHYMIDSFLNLQKNHSQIGDVRGSGLFIGVEMVKDPDSKAPDTQLAGHIKEQLKHQNILISTDGPADNVLKIKPPMCFTKENVHQVVSSIEQVLNTC